MTKRQIVLEDRMFFFGERFGSDREISGEVVFNTNEPIRTKEVDLL